MESRALGAAPLAPAVETCSAASQPDLSDAERATVTKVIEARMNDYASAARRLDLDWFRAFWANSEAFVIAADGNLMDYPTWDEQLAKDLATIREMSQFEFFDGHTYVLARDAAVHTTRFRWILVGTTGDTIRMQGSWSYVFKILDGTWQVVHSAGTHLPQ